MANVSMRDMLKAGVHFGHQTRFWNPRNDTAFHFPVRETKFFISSNLEVYPVPNGSIKHWIS